MKKLRRVGIAGATAANAFLETTYLPEHNARFAQAPASAEDFHRRTPSRGTLDRAFQIEETRVLSNDWVIRYDTRYFQVARQSHQAPARSTELVREAVTGAIELRYRGRLMRWHEIPAPPPRPPLTPTAARAATSAAATGGRRAVARPNADHPWRRGFDERQPRAVEGPRPRGFLFRNEDGTGEGDISILLRTGTFLFRVDTFAPCA